MAAAPSRAIPFWFPLAVIALLIAWPTADRVRAATHDERIVVADLRADELLLVDVDTGAVTGRIALPGGGHELLELPDGRVAVSIEQQGLIAIVDLKSRTVEEQAIGGVPHGLAFDGDVLLVTDRSVDQVRRFALDDWRELEPVATDHWPHAVALAADGRLVVASALDSSLAIGDARIEVSELPETVAVGPDGAIATAGAVGGALHVFAGDGSEELRVALGGRPVRVVFSPDGATIAVALSANGEIALVDRAGIVRTVAVPGVPDGLAFSTSGRRLYAGDVAGGGLATIDVGTATLVDVREIGTATGAILTR